MRVSLPKDAGRQLSVEWPLGFGIPLGWVLGELLSSSGGDGSTVRAWARAFVQRGLSRTCLGARLGSRGGIGQGAWGSRGRSMLLSSAARMRRGSPSTGRVNAEHRMLLFFISPLGLQLPACVCAPKRLSKRLAGACSSVGLGEKQDVQQALCCAERCCASSRALQKAPGKVSSSFLPPSGLCSHSCNYWWGSACGAQCFKALQSSSSFFYSLAHCRHLVPRLGPLPPQASSKHPIPFFFLCKPGLGQRGHFFSLRHRDTSGTNRAPLQ